MGDESQAGDVHNITWSDELEGYFASSGEKAHCFSWMHKHSEEVYSLRRTYIDLPVILLSSLTGFCTAGSETFFRGNTTMASVVLGVSSLFVGMLNTAGSYFGWSKRAEGHRLSAIHYAKLFRQISVEMRLPREERMRARDFLKVVREQYDRLAETSPMIPRIVIRSFRQKFGKSRYDGIAKPEEANGLERILIIPSNTRFPQSSSPPLPRLKIPSNRYRGESASSASDETKFEYPNPMRRIVTLVSPASMAAIASAQTPPVSKLELDTDADADNESSDSRPSPPRTPISSVRVESPP